MARIAVGTATYAAGVAARILVLDNYDSFVYNLVQYLGELGADPVVFRHDAIDLDEVTALAPDGVLISPGPGRPEDAGISNQVITALGGAGTPVLGVCLGHQCIGQVFGGEVVRAASVMHGKTSLVHHHGAGVLAGLPDPFQATRYHSLVVDGDSVPDVLEITAWTEDGTVMGLRHRELPIEGVQFHPESILTAEGHRLIGTWLARCQAPVAS
jgi:anthranilate synthase/aminodeoxychorismate synthase-like glutamine amidotransferase